MTRLPSSIVSCFIVSILVAVFASQNEAAASPGAPAVIITLPQTNQVALLDPSTGEIEGVYYVAGDPSQVVANPARGFAYIAVNNGSGIAVFDKLYHEVSKVVSVPAGFSTMQISRDGSIIYALSSAGTLSVVSLPSGDIISTLSVGASPGGEALSPQLHRLFVSLPSTDQIEIIDTRTLGIVEHFYGGWCDRTHGGCDPGELAMSPDGRYLFGAGSQNILAFDGASGKILDLFHLSYPGAENFLGVDAEQNALLYGYRFGNFVNVGSILMDPPFGGGPFGAGFRRDTGFSGLASNGTGTTVWTGIGNYFEGQDGLLTLNSNGSYSCCISLGEFPGGLAVIP
jgi:DNA-binding beta-propeller fold protein YncE